MRGRYWLSSKAMTIEVTVGRDGKGYNNQKLVTDAPPIARKFIGQPLGSLVGWMQKQGDFEMREL
jgi:hypothetical protein